MKLPNCFSVVLAILFSISTLAANIKVDVQLNPAGSFQIQSSKVSGSVSKSGDQLIAKNISVKVSSFKTGLDLRDKHTKEKLQYKKHPKISINKAQASGGKGKAEIEIMGVKKITNFSYSIVGNDVSIEFPLSLSLFGISGISYMGIGVNDIINVKAELPIK